MNTMSFEAQAPAPLISQTPEVMRKIAMGETVRKILLSFTLEQATLENFNFGGRAHKIDSVSAAIKAIGQLPTSISNTVYQESLRSQH